APRGPKCVLCGNHTYSFECTTVKLAKVRQEILRWKKLCFCCLSSEHNSADCSRKRVRCSGKHHRSFCEKHSNTAVNMVSMQQPERLFTTTETVVNPDPDTSAVFLDHGAQATLISMDLVNRLALHFDDTVEKQGDEYIVQYSFKPEAKTDLPSNYDLTQSNLEYYDSILKYQLSLGQNEIVDQSDNDGIIHYLAHQPVLRPDKPSPSHSPSDLKQIPAIYDPDPDYVFLCRCREGVPSSKPASNSNILVLRFCVTQFGINASLSILNKVIHHQTMSMNLRDYASNDPSFLSIVPDSDRAKDETQKILGLVWGTTTNRLSINTSISNKSGKVSKRSIPYDHLGLLNPLTLPPRLTTQNLWNTSLKWDGPVDDSIRSTFHEQIYAHLSDSDEITLVAFSYASKQVMAACIYSWSTNAQPTLLISKNRLGPIKCTSTIPKM
ncbi:hypothetical protein PRIPAC_94633, partial [Pristionchus pacificus]|uniref:Uncharacterized protein n=1 Tax=Pristionchus pacificus TaxID=54126 RepID=A0A2A6CI60_PRIPA